MMAETSPGERERQALDYLRRELAGRAPSAITPEASFGERPLDDEGPATVFSFDLPPASGDCPAVSDGPEAGNRLILSGATEGKAAAPAPASAYRHYVVAGQTRANYFPAYGLDPDDAYSLHIGTRFMLEMRIGMADPADEPPAARQAVYATVMQVAPDAAVGDVSLAALFRVGDALYAVYRLQIAGSSAYFLGADSPPGFYRLTHLPPQVVLRLHLGKLIRAEPGQPA